MNLGGKMRKASGCAEPKKGFMELKMFGEDAEKIKERTEREALSAF